MYEPSEADRKKVELAFTYHGVKVGQMERYAEVRERALDFASYLIRNCPSSRELSLALTHLEECVDFGNAAIARNE